MTRRPVLALVATLVSAACDRQALGPRPADVEPTLASHQADDDGPPPPYRFGRDSRETGVATGQGVVEPGLQCTDLTEGRRRCTGYLPSDVDGTLLDVTVDLPADPTPADPNDSGNVPLVTLLHGWGGSKSGDEDIVQSLVSDGMAVLRYSARGFGNSFGRVNLSDVGVEVAPAANPIACARRPGGDLQSMIGHVVDQVVDLMGRPVINPTAVAVAGTSYGGGQTWLAALRPRFRSANGTCVQIRTIVPIVPWTDLLYSLVPNGETRRSFDPPGGLKLSYVNALYASGCKEPAPTSPVPCKNYPEYLKVWHAWLNAAEPTRADPVFRQIADGLAGHRSIWWQQDFWRAAALSPIPVFQVQGLTDDLFTFEEARRMLAALKSVNPSYPIASYFGDIGHPRATNKRDEMAYALQLLRDWLRTHLNDIAGDEPAPMIHAAITRPRTLEFDPTRDVITVERYDQLSTNVRTYTFTNLGAIANPVSGAGGSASRDPLVQVGAAGLIAAGEWGTAVPTMPPPAVPDPSALAYEVAVPGEGMLIAGQPLIHIEGFTTAPRVQLNVRLLDVAPDGAAELITRGTHTLEAEPAGPLGAITLRIRTAGNVYAVPGGHTLRLEIFNVDAPYMRPSAFPSVTQVSKVELLVPINEQFH